MAYKVAADGTETSLGAVNISNEAANILYGAPNPPVAGTGTTIPTYNLVADTAGGLLVRIKYFRMVHLHNMNFKVLQRIIQLKLQKH